MRFEPHFCPNPDCTSRAREDAFRFRRMGYYRRRCDGRKVQRFQCRACRRSFSVQTFRPDYRFKLPHQDRRIFRALVEKVGQRRTARIFGLDRKSIARREHRWAPMMREGRGSVLATVATDADTLAAWRSQ